jgi:MOSC domain-containing protein YiiM
MHEIRDLWIRPERRSPLEARDELSLVTGEGIVGDHTRGGRRHVTIVFENDWAAAIRDLGRPVDPVARRANLLVSGGRGEGFLEKKVRLGEALIEIRGIVAPCARMDEAADGLRAALEPDARGGIWGVVIEGGTIRRGDELFEVPPA